MIPLNALVIYKTKPAVVKEITGDKYNITLISGTQAKVREKDIELLHPGPVKSLDGFNEADITACIAGDHIREAWELLSDEENTRLSLKELAAFIFSDFTPVSAYAAYCVLQDGLYFRSSDGGESCSEEGGVVLCSREEVESQEAKRREKSREGEERAQFLERCKKNKLTKEDLLNADRFIQDVEALALGKSAKSRTMRELKLGETPEEAHEFLLKTGIWSNMINPHPYRYGIGLNSLQNSTLQSNGEGICPIVLPDEPRRDLCRLEAYAIDSPWSDDPDDAVSIEAGSEEWQFILYVHVADPASSIMPDSPLEKEARDRGVTIYLPEATVRMIPEEYLPVFALGLSEKSFALTFKMTINKDGEIENTEIFPSVVKAQRLSYEEADKLMEEKNSVKGCALQKLHGLALCLFKRRCENGAVNIDLPDVHLKIVVSAIKTADTTAISDISPTAKRSLISHNGTVNITPIKQYKSSFIVRECMIAAGEGAGTWASEKGLAMPYLSQEAELPNKILPGLAGSMQLRKSMRPRVISVKPGRHQGMGLDIYTQVTSPLRRYTDLLAHMQIRAWLRAAAGDKDSCPLTQDEVSARFGFSEAGAMACVQAERASDLHWKMVYLQDKKDSVWDAVAVEKKGNRWLVIIPALALETQVALDKDAAPNEEVKVILKSVNIPRGEAVFITA